MQRMEHRAIILAGGNIGDVAASFIEAERLLAERGVEVVAKSQLHRSRAWGFESEEEFVNCAYEVATELEAEALLDLMQRVEELLGRNREEERKVKQQRGESYASRRIDLDMMFYDEARISSERLQVPHPLIMEREFAITPLCELLQCSREALQRKIFMTQR